MVLATRFPALSTRYMLFPRNTSYTFIRHPWQSLHLIFSRVYNWSHVFPRFLLCLTRFTTFPAIDTGYIFPAIDTGYIFPALGTGYTFPAIYRWLKLSRANKVGCYFALDTGYMFMRSTFWDWHPFYFFAAKCSLHISRALRELRAFFSSLDREMAAPAVITSLKKEQSQRKTNKRYLLEELFFLGSFLLI